MAPKEVSAAVESKEPLAIFNALWNLMMAPSRIIGPFYPECTSRREEGVIEAAMKKIRIGQESKAMRLLSSNGVAEATPEVIQALESLHPKRTEPLRPPKPKVEQLHLSSAAIAKYLYDAAESTHVTKDAMGWSAALLFPCRGTPDGLLTAVSRMLELFTQTLTCSPLLAHNCLRQGSSHL